MSNWNVPDDVTLVDIKKEMFTTADLAEMHRITGSYEALFSKRSRNFETLGVKYKIKNDADYGHYLPQDYTFLKRPLLLYDEQIFIGNDAKTVASAQLFLKKLALE